MPAKHNVYAVEDETGIRQVGTISTSVIYLLGHDDAADAQALPVDELKLVTGTTSVAGLGLSAGSHLEKAINAILGWGAQIVVHRMLSTATPADQGGSAANRTGVYMSLLAKSQLGVKPKLLIAPGWSADATVATALESAANTLLGAAIIDGPNTTASAATTAAGTRTDSKGRVLFVDPYVRSAVGGDDIPASAYVAGLQAWIDVNEGFWRSPTNHVLRGVAEAARPVEFELGRDDTEAGTLIAAGVTTIVRVAGGYRLWGVRSIHGATNLSSLYGQWNQRRTLDAFAESVQVALLWALGQGITVGLGDAVVEQVRSYARTLKALGAIAGARVWLDEELNTPENLGAGRVYIDYAVTPTPAAEEITGRLHVTNEFLAEVVG